MKVGASGSRGTGPHGLRLRLENSQWTAFDATRYDPQSLQLRFHMLKRTPSSPPSSNMQLTFRPIDLIPAQGSVLHFPPRQDVR